MNEFKDSSNTMVITLDEILTGTKPVLYVSHDEEDGMWQFLDGSSGLDTSSARIVGLEEILELDCSLNLIMDLPLGWIAERESIDSMWEKRKM